MVQTLEAEKAIRRETLEPLFTELDEQGRSLVWLARQLGIKRSVLVNYRYGWRRMPPALFQRACAIIGIAPERIPLDKAPHSILFQGTQRRRGEAMRQARGPPAA